MARRNIPTRKRELIFIENDTVGWFYQFLFIDFFLFFFFFSHIKTERTSCEKKIEIREEINYEGKKRVNALSSIDLSNDDLFLLFHHILLLHTQD